jgi:hypothetical protein
MKGVAVVIGGYPDIIFQCKQEVGGKNVERLPVGGEYVLNRGVAGASSLRRDVQADPKHGRSVPDYAKIDDYLLLGHDLGDPYISQVVKIASDIKTK